MKKEYIITEAKQIKQYIEKNKKIPQTNTYTDGTIYSIYTTSFLLANLIRNWSKKDIPKTDVIRYNQKTLSDTINEKVLKEDYLRMIDNFIKYCKENRRVPTYVTTQKSKTKTSFELFTFCLAKIVVYYAENDTLPNYCLFVKGFVPNTTTKPKPSKNNSSTSASCQNKINSRSGCDAMGQNNNYYCGVSALQKCLYKFGINETQKQLARVCGTTTAGTSHQGLKTGIAYVSKKHGVKLSVKEAYFSDYNLKQLKQILCDKNKAIICHSLYRNKYGHYESWKSVNVDKKEIDVINSLGDKCALGCLCGYIEHRPYATQKQYCNGISQKSLLIITRG